MPPKMNMVIPPEMNMVMPPEMNMVICNCCVVEQECNAAQNEQGKTARNEHGNLRLLRCRAKLYYREKIVSMIIYDCCVVEQDYNTARNEHGNTAGNEHGNL